MVKKWSYIQTFTGKKFDVVNPRVSDICVEDIAHSLSLQCRFNGHTVGFYSVGHHSFLVSQQVPEEDALWGLLHDAAEAYVGDLVYPLKYSGMVGSYRSIEMCVMVVICKKFGLSPETPESVKEADVRMLWTEKRDLLSPCDWSDAVNTVAEPYDFKIKPWSPKYGERSFLERFKKLMQQS